MNAPILFSLVASSALAALTVSPLPVTTPAPEPPGAVSTGWDFVEMQIVADPDRYREQTSRALHRCAHAVQKLDAQSTFHHTRPYLDTRVQALRQHLDYARAEFLKLPASSGDAVFFDAHAHFHRTLRHLEAALAQAAAEIGDGA